MPANRVTDELLQVILARYHDLGPTYAMAQELVERRAAEKDAHKPDETPGGAVYEAVKSKEGA